MTDKLKEAFPYLETGDCGQRAGMTLRDYFAAKAMAVVWDAYDKGYSSINQDDFDSDALARHAYKVADAMMEARK